MRSKQRDTERHPLHKALYTVAEAGIVLGRKRTKIYELIAQGRLAAVKLDGGTLITGQSIDKLVAGLPAASIGSAN